MYIGRRATAHYSCQMLIKLEFSRQIFEKHSNIKFRKNPSNGSRVFPCEKMDGRTDKFDEANIAFRNFVNTPKMTYFRDKDQLVCFCDGMMEMQCALM
jgi:hypothetical protein